MNINIFVASYLSKNSPRFAEIRAKDDAGLGKLTFVDNEHNSISGLSVMDRALNYGDGCFTTMYCEAERLFLFESHIARLQRDSQKLAIHLCTETVKYWIEQASSMLMLNEIEAAVVKVLVSRGVGGRGYEPPISPTTQVIISFFPTAKLDISNLIKGEYQYCVEIANMQLSSQTLLSGVKHLNRLEQVLAKLELTNRDCDDLLLCNAAGNLIEATSSNLFYLKNGVWYTPKIKDCGVNGIMRDAIMEFMRIHDIPYESVDTALSDLIYSESVFLCNAVKFIIPVSALRTGNQVIQFSIEPSGNLLFEVYAWLKVENNLNSESYL